MGLCRYWILSLIGFFIGLLCVKTTTGIIHGIGLVNERAERLYHDARNETTLPLARRPERRLCRCLEGVFGESCGETSTTSTTTTLSTSTTTTTTTTPTCIYSGLDGIPPKMTRHRRQVPLKEHFTKFHRFLCRERRSCKLDLKTIGYSRETLNRHLGQHRNTDRRGLVYSNIDFTCRLSRGFMLTCQETSKPSTSFHKFNMFKGLLECLSTTLEHHICSNPPTTVHRDPVRPTGSPAALKRSSLPVGMIILVLGCVVCLLLGVLASICCIVCWRRRRKRDKESMKRPVPSVRANSYIPTPLTEPHVYEELPMAPDPPARRPTVLTQFGSEGSVETSSFNFNRSESRQHGYYEPLVRDESGMEICPLPEDRSHVPSRRPSIPHSPVLSEPMDPADPVVHDYLDLIEPNARVETSPTDTRDDQDSDSDSSSIENAEILKHDYCVLEKPKEDEEVETKVVITGGASTGTDEDISVKIHVEESKSFDIASTYEGDRVKNNQKEVLYQDYQKITRGGNEQGIQNINQDSGTPEDGNKGSTSAGNTSRDWGEREEGTACPRQPDSGTHEYFELETTNL